MTLFTIALMMLLTFDAMLRRISLVSTVPGAMSTNRNPVDSRCLVLILTAAGSLRVAPECEDGGCENIAVVWKL